MTIYTFESYVHSLRLKIVALHSFEQLCVRIWIHGLREVCMQIPSGFVIYHRDFEHPDKVFNTQIVSKDSKLVIPIPEDKCY